MERKIAMGLFPDEDEALTDEVLKETAKLLSRDGIQVEITKMKVS